MGTRDEVHPDAEAKLTKIANELYHINFIKTARVGFNKDSGSFGSHDITMPLKLNEGFGSKWIERDEFKKVINSIEAIMKKFKIDLYWELVFDNNQPAIVIYPLSEKEEQKLKL